MRFDAYCGNVAGGVPEEVGSVLAASIGGRLVRGAPRRRYTDVFEVRDGADMAGWLGYDRPLQAAYFEFKGTTTPDVAACIRRHWADQHTVSRVDSCEDYDEPGAFERLVGILDECKDPRVTSILIAPREGDRGRTINFGSVTSRVQNRVYEAGKMRERLHFGRPHWVRTEVEVRPGKAIEKRAAAKLGPVDVWGFAAWTKRAAEVLTQCEVPRFAPPSTPPEFDRTTLYLARQFRAHWQEMLADLGDWECIGREFQAIWAADDEAASHAKARGG